MLNRLKDRAKITDTEPIFHAKYIGSVETFSASGKGCTTPLVQKLWDNSEEERYLRRVQIKITTSGIHMKNLEKKKEPERYFNIENISFCNVDSTVNDRIFSWICKDDVDQLLECHAVFCSNTEKAKTMALVLSRAFQIAYKEWKSGQTKVAREIEKDRRASTIANVSLSEKRQSSKAVTRQRIDSTPEAMTSFNTTENRTNENVVNGGSDVSQTGYSLKSNGVSVTNASESIDPVVQVEQL